MKNALIGLMLLGVLAPGFAQVTEAEELSEVELVAVNYRYLDQASKDEMSVPVKLLRNKVANFDVKNSEYYQDDYDLYEINFFIPEGAILASYDRDGKILRTVERFKNVSLPMEVRNAVAKRFPNWAVTKDIYRVNYHETKGTKKLYKLRLENQDKRMWVKTDEKGNFM